jgi:hypothetical protein
MVLELMVLPRRGQVRRERARHLERERARRPERARRERARARREQVRRERVAAESPVVERAEVVVHAPRAPTAPPPERSTSILPGSSFLVFPRFKRQARPAEGTRPLSIILWAHVENCLKDDLCLVVRRAGCLPGNPSQLPSSAVK